VVTDIPILITDLVSGHVTFDDRMGNKLSVPSDAWVRLVPSREYQKNSYEGLRCKVNSAGNFGQECYIYSDEEGMRNAFNDSSETFQIVVFKNHILPNEKDWNCGENLYRYVGTDLSASSWSDILVNSVDFQDRSLEICLEPNNLFEHIEFHDNTLKAYFSEEMITDIYHTTGEYVPARSYWSNKRTFIIEFESYTPGGTIVLQSDGFVSEQGISMTSDISYVFPKNDVPTPTPAAPVPLVSNLNISDFSPNQGIVALRFNVSPEGGMLVTLKAHCAANSSYTYLYDVKDCDATKTGNRSILFKHSEWKGHTVYCKIEAVNSNGKKAPVLQDSTYISN
jgi:hypothetical protein